MKTGKEAFEEQNRAVGHHNKGEYTHDRVPCQECGEKVKHKIKEGPTVSGELLYTEWECLNCRNRIRL